MLEVHRNVIAADVRGHGDDRCGVVELPHEVCRRYSVEIGHDDVHEDKVILCTRVQFVNGFQTVKL